MHAWYVENGVVAAVINTAAQFAGEGSYIELPKSLMPHRSADSEETIEFTVTTRQENALLFWHGQTPLTSGRGKDYVAVAIVNGYIVFRYEI